MKISTILVEEVERFTFPAQDYQSLLEVDQEGRTLTTHPNLKTHKPLLQKIEACFEKIKQVTEAGGIPRAPLRLLFLIPDFSIDVGEWRLIRAKLDQPVGQKAFLFRYHLAHTASFHHWANELLVKIDDAVAKHSSQECHVVLLSYSTGSILVRLALQLLHDTSGGADTDAFLLKSPRRPPEQRDWKCHRVIMLAPATFGIGFNKDKHLDQSTADFKVSPVESVAARVRPTSTFLEHLADGDLFLPPDRQYLCPSRVQVFVIQGTKQSPDYPDGAYRTRGTDGLVPYSASAMKAAKWYLDLDSNAPDVDTEEKETLTTSSAVSSVQCAVRYCPHHDHKSLLQHFFTQRDVYHHILSILRSPQGEYEQVRQLFVDHGGDWNVARSRLHRGASLIVFRYTGQQFPVLVPEVVEHSMDIKVQFHQPMSRGIKYFHYLEDLPALDVLLKSFFGKNNFTGKSFYNLVDFGPVGSYFQAMGSRQNKAYSFLIRFEGHPCARVIGSTQWIDGPHGAGFFPHVSASSALWIDVSPSQSEPQQFSIGTALNPNAPRDRLISQIDCLPYLSSVLEETGVDVLGQIFSRFLDSSDKELGRLLDVVVGANHAILEASARVVLIQALYPFLKRTVAVSAVFALLVGMPNRQVRTVTNMLESSSRKGYFTLYSLIYVKLDRNLPEQAAYRFRPATSSWHVREEKQRVNLKDEVLKFFRTVALNRNPQEPHEWRLLALARDVLVNKSNPCYPSGSMYPGAQVCLKAFYKKYQTEILVLDRSSVFLRGIRKRPGVAAMTKPKNKSYSTVISEYMALYPGASFIFLLSSHHETLQVSPATDKQPKPLIFRFTKEEEVTRTSQIILQRSAHCEVGDNAEEEEEEDDDYDEPGELLEESGLVHAFQSHVGLARQWMEHDILPDSAFMGILKDTLVEWRDLIFQDPRSVLFEDLVHFEQEVDQLSGLTLSAMVKNQQIKQQVRRLYPSLLLSEEGLDTLLALRAAQDDPNLSIPSLTMETLLPPADRPL